MPLFGVLLPALFAIVVLCACVRLSLLAVLESVSITNRTYAFVLQSIPTSVCHCCVTYHSDSIALTTRRPENIGPMPLFGQQYPTLTLLCYAP